MHLKQTTKGIVIIMNHEERQSDDLIFKAILSHTRLSIYLSIYLSNIYASVSL